MHHFRLNDRGLENTRGHWQEKSIASVWRVCLSEDGGAKARALFSYYFWKIFSRLQ